MYTSMVQRAIVFTGMALCLAPALAAYQPADYVDPFIGAGGVGHTFPGAVVPFGMVQLSPDTGGTHGLWLSSAWKWCAGYHYSDTTILGFSHLHRSGMGAGDWGDVLVTPVTGDLKVLPGEESAPEKGYRSRFSHNSELAHPGYYAVFLDDYDIRAELTAARRSGFHRYTFPESPSSRVLIDLGHGLGDSSLQCNVEIRGDDKITGYRNSTGRVPYQAVYFCARFNKPFKSHGTWKGARANPGNRTERGAKIGAFANYETGDGEALLVKVGISYTSAGQACANLEHDIPGWDFEAARKKAWDEWNRELGKVMVQPSGSAGAEGPKRLMTVFYTSLYHSFLFPATCSDHDGAYKAINNMPWKLRKADGFTYYSDYSIWDTFRSEMPLIMLLQPERARDMMSTLVAQYRDSGWLPTPQQFGNFHTEGMAGDHSSCVILDAHLKGIDGYDKEAAYQAMRKNAMQPGHNIIPCTGFGVGRYGIKHYKRKGWVPADFVINPDNLLFIAAYVYNQGASRTLAYAYDDCCVAWMAKDLGKTGDYVLFRERADNWKNVFDPETGFARGKSRRGEWMNQGDFDPTAYYAYYTEGNAWQWTWSVFHDVGGLIELMGGREAFNQKLDSLFSAPEQTKAYEFFAPHIGGMIGQYAHGNEPSHHVVYLYDYSGEPWKSQELARRIMDEYKPSPEGLSGNEDMGQMSSWYVFSAMGLYPIHPGIYLVGSPLFEQAAVQLKGAAELIIRAENVSGQNKYIQRASINGSDLEGPWLMHEQIRDGGELVFHMGPAPNKEWGSDTQDAPPSMMDLLNDSL